jgi:glycosyltransferase involved in cell wall biosynthesis
MRLIFLSIEFSIGTFSGNGIYAISQVRALRQLGHQVLVICGRPSGSNSTASDDDKTLLSIPLPVWNRLDLESSWKEYALGCGAPHIVNAALSFNADVVLGVDWHSYTAYKNLSEALKAKICCSTSSSFHKIPPYACSNYRIYLRSNSESDENVELIRKLEGDSLLLGICSTVLSQSDQNFVQENYHSNTNLIPLSTLLLPPLQVILPALRADLAAIPFLPQPGGDKKLGRKYLLCCVRASPEKEPHRFVELICELERRDFFVKHGIVPLIAGAGWKINQEISISNFSSSIEKYVSDLRQQIKTHAPSCEIIETFLGPAEMARIYSQTVLNIHPPAYDAFGMTICEAASQMAPSLVAWHGHVGATDLLNPEKKEIFVTDMEDCIENLANVVENLVENRENLKIVGEAAAAVVRKWNEEANAAAAIGALENALASVEKVPSSPPLLQKLMTTTRKRGGAVDVLPFTSSSHDETSTNSSLYKHFEENYLEANKPVIFSGIATDWLATKEWLDPTTGVVLVENLKRKFGNFKIVATDADRRHRGEGPCKEMTVAEYCQWWKEKDRNHLDRVPPNGSGDGSDEKINDEEEDHLWYLKDWNFVKDASSSIKQKLNQDSNDFYYYQLPIYFSDDWLNEWYDSLPSSSSDLSSSSALSSSSDQPSDYRFLYLGPQGSFTPLHTDVLKSHSWSVNIAGRKLWRLLPAEYASFVQDKSTGMSHPYDFYPEELEEDPSTSKSTNCSAMNTRFPGLRQAQQHIIEILQYPGEAIFIPSGWFHTVLNLDDCLSINHNWISSHSVMNSWRYLQKERARAEELIEDCREITGVAEFEMLVQRNVDMNAGIGYSKFGAILRYIATKAVENLGGDESVHFAEQRLAVAEKILCEVVEEQEKVILGCGDSCSEIKDEEIAREALLNEIKLNKECLELIAAAFEKLK